MTTTARRSACPAPSTAPAQPSSPTPVFAYPGPPEHEFGWSEIAAALVRAKGITSGWWRVGAQLRFAGITARMGEPGKEMASPASPTALVGFEGLALFASTQGGDLVFDAGNDCAPVPLGAVAPEPAKATPQKKIKVTVRKRPAA